MSIILKLYFILILLLILISCENKWNSYFIEGKINKENIKNELQIGSNYEKLLLYIKKNNIPKHLKDKNFGFSEKIFSLEGIEDFDNNLKDRFKYVIRIDGHKNYLTFPNYYHPILYFFYDRSNSLIYIGEWAYP